MPVRYILLYHSMCYSKHIHICAISTTRIKYSYSISSAFFHFCVAVFSAKLSAEELADWLHSHHDLPEGACKILKGEGGVCAIIYSRYMFVQPVLLT